MYYDAYTTLPITSNIPGVSVRPWPVSRSWFIAERVPVTGRHRYVTSGRLLTISWPAYRFIPYGTNRFCCKVSLYCTPLWSTKARFLLSELTARVNGPCWRVMETDHPSTRAVNSGSENRAWDVSTRQYFATGRSAVADIQRDAIVYTWNQDYGLFEVIGNSTDELKRKIDLYSAPLWEVHLWRARVWITQFYAANTPYLP